MAPCAREAARTGFGADARRYAPRQEALSIKMSILRWSYESAAFFTTRDLREGSSTTNEWRPARFRLLICTYDAPLCGPLVRADEMTKSKNDPRPYFFWITTPVTVYAAGCGALVHPRLARAFDKVEIIPVSNYDRQIRFRRVKRRKRGRRLRDLQRGWRRRRCQRCGGGQSGRGVCLMGVPHDRSLGGSTASSPARPPAQTGSGSSLSDTPV